MMASKQITNAEIFVFIADLVFKLSSREDLFKNKKIIETVKSRLIFKKVANFTGKFLQNCK